MGTTVSPNKILLICAGLALCREALRHRDASLQTDMCTRCTCDVAIKQSKPSLKWVEGSCKQECWHSVWTAAVQGHSLLYVDKVRLATATVRETGGSTTSGTYAFGEHWWSTVSNLFVYSTATLLAVTAVTERMLASRVVAYVNMMRLLWLFFGGQKSDKFGVGAAAYKHCALTGADMMIGLLGVVALLPCSLSVQVFGIDLRESKFRLTGTQHVKNHVLDLNFTIACRVTFVVLLSEFELRSQGHVMDIRSCHSRIISIAFTSERPASATGLHTVCVFPFRLFISVLSVGHIRLAAHTE